MIDFPPRQSDENEMSDILSLAEDWPTLAVLDRRYIDLVLERMGGNKTRAAEILGIDRRTLNRIFARERAASAAREALEDELFGRAEALEPRRLGNAG